MVDLFRIKGISEEYSELLEASGVNTVPELAGRNPEHLYKKIIEVNNEKKLVRRPPSESMVASWIEQAKKLPRKVEY
jgi:predicted flap endonuclease-1-like 5' DNA nuclease